MLDRSRERKSARRKEAAPERTPEGSPAIPRIGLGMLLRTADMTFNRAMRDELAAHGITFSQFQHLFRLWESDGLTQVELSRRIGIQMASSTSVLDSLERNGLIRRVRQSKDRRKINVFLTPAGAALEKPLTACAAGVNARARRGLSAAEVAMLFGIVEKITKNLNGRNEERG
jgi:MarR family transcriptional regulator, organic hydroperoxide resistance regulator